MSLALESLKRVSSVVSECLKHKRQKTSGLVSARRRGHRRSLSDSAPQRPEPRAAATAVRRDTEDEIYSAGMEEDRKLDEAFLGSLGFTLPGSGAAIPGDPTGAPPGSNAFDLTRVLKRPVSATGMARVLERTKSQESDGEEFERKRRLAQLTLTAPEYLCWVNEQDLQRHRKEEQKMRSQIFNGDPLLPLEISNPAPEVAAGDAT